MRRSSRAAAASIFATAAVLALPGTAWPHAFGQRYDLPAPLGYFVAGAAAAVVLSFVVAAVFARGAPRASPDEGLVVPLGPLLPLLRASARALSVVLLGVVLIAGVFGSRNPEMNFATILVWIVWWVGLSLVVACFGNIWSALDPWRSVFDGLERLARRFGFASTLSLGWRYPQGLGAWPAVFFLLLFVWIELIYPRAAAPLDLAWMAGAWSMITLAGMVCFGEDAWRRNADVFAIYFDTLGRFAPIAAAPDGRGIVLRAPGRALIAGGSVSIGMVGFILAMLSTVMFDGLLGTQVMALSYALLADWMSLHPLAGGYVLGTAGVIGVWLAFLLAYLLACRATAWLVRDLAAGAVARLFVRTLVPIAIAYNVAHYFSYLVVQGQLIIPLLSDPLGRGWDLFGTARVYPDIGIIEARAVWHLAIVSIVAGHVISIWLAHRLALREFGARRAVVASMPLTALMVAYTVLSLLIIADPLVQFTDSAAPR
ncbi:MAG TPA: hypothetical protein VH881_11545 [Burkholderiales bacterium]|jgi:hypothetical protein